MCTCIFVLTLAFLAVRSSAKTPLMSVLLKGQANSGKTALAAKAAVESDFPFIRMISADEMIGHSELAKCATIHKAFMDSYKSPLSLILIDDIERIIEDNLEFLLNSWNEEKGKHVNS